MKDVEQDKEQHGKQGEVEDVVGEGFTESSQPGEAGEVADTAFTLLAQEV